jgi:hypothetical protein
MFESEELKTPIIKLIFDDNFFIKSYTFNELVQFYNIHNENTQKEKQLHYEKENKSNLSTMAKFSKKNSKAGVNINQQNQAHMIQSSQMIKEFNAIINSSSINSPKILNRKGNLLDKKSLYFMSNSITPGGGNTYTNNYINNAMNKENRPVILKISEFDSVLNKALKSNTPTIPAQNQIKDILLTHTSNQDTSSYQINKTKKTINEKNQSFHHHGIYLELYHYFTENNLDIGLFGEIFHNINNSFSLSDKENKSYSVIVCKTASYRKFHRVAIRPFEKIEENRSYLFIVEGKMFEIQKFLNDVFVFTEGIKNNDESSLVNLVTNRKIDELRGNFEVVDEEHYNVINAKTKNTLLAQPSSNLPSSKELQQKSKNEQQQTILSINQLVSPKKVIFQCTATRILPTKYQNGLFVIHYNPSNVGSSICEFISVNNNYKKKSLKFELNRVRHIVKYRFLYQYKALNIFLFDSKYSKILDFETEGDFLEVFYFLLEKSPKLDRSFNDIKYHTNLWVDGLMTNYDYLIYLNTMSGRSFVDLSQYPIMPWVLTNYEDEESFIF